MSKFNFNQHPTDVAISFSADSQYAVCASYGPSGEIETVNLPLESGLFVSLANWRSSLGFETTLQTTFRFVPSFFTEQTRIAALSDEVLSIESDEELTEFLIAAAQQELTGTDGAVIFESDIHRSAYDFVRLPSREITLTELPRDVLRQTVKKLLSAEPLDPKHLRNLTIAMPEDLQPFLMHSVETRLRVVARAVAAGSERDYFDSLSGDATLAFIVATADGFGFALWSAERTFYLEAGEVFHSEYDENEIPAGMSSEQFQEQRYKDALTTFLYEHFYSRVVPEDETSAVNLKRVYWVAANEVARVVPGVLSEFSESTSLLCQAVPYELDELIVTGLLLGTDERAESLVPGVNLANDISIQSTEIEAGKRNSAADSLQLKRFRAIACVVLPILVCFGIALGMLVNNWRKGISLGKRETVAKKEKERLQPVLKAREEYEKTLKWYQDVLRQIVGLRQKQMSSLGFAARLDPLYPSVSSFYISEMKILPGGAFELKGLSKDEVAVADFVRTMEVAVDDSSARLFNGLAVDFKQGSKIEGAGATSSTISSGSLAPGVVAFSIKGSFAPAAGLKAQPAGPAPPPNAAPVNVPSPGPVGSNTNSNTGGGR